VVSRGTVAAAFGIYMVAASNLRCEVVDGERARLSVMDVVTACEATLAKHPSSGCDAWPPPPQVRTTDRWDGALRCVTDSSGRAEVVSLGADGRAGGAGNAADVHCRPVPARPEVCTCRRVHWMSPALGCSVISPSRCAAPELPDHRCQSRMDG
jgi:hypothetical protein